MTLPNFLVIGAQKAGTTAIYHFLDQHPQIFMSPVKEPHFFAFGDGNGDYRDLGFETPKMVLDIDRYQELFSNVNAEIAIGEASPSYLYNQQAPFRIKQYLPDVKLIAILRNPIDRAYSNYLHCRRDGRETINDFSKALEAENKRIAEKWSDLWHYKHQGFYYSQLVRYFELFDREQIKIIIYDDLVANPAVIMQDLFYFLGVEKSFKVDISTKHNVSGVPKNSMYMFLFKIFNPYHAQLKRIIPYDVRQFIRQKIMDKPEMLSKTRYALVKEYKRDIIQLSNLLERDLSNWLEYD